MRNSYAANRDHHVMYARNYRVMNPERTRKNARRYYQANREIIRERVRERYVTNHDFRESVRIYARKYRAANRERITERRRQNKRKLRIRKRLAVPDCVWREILTTKPQSPKPPKTKTRSKSK
jgi:hypothetical protein